VNDNTLKKVFQHNKQTVTKSIKQTNNNNQKERTSKQKNQELLTANKNLAENNGSGIVVHLIGTCLRNLNRLHATSFQSSLHRSTGLLSSSLQLLEKWMISFALRNSKILRSTLDGIVVR